MKGEAQQVSSKSFVKAADALAQLPHAIISPRIIDDIRWPNYSRIIGYDSLADPRHKIHRLFGE